MRDKQGRYYIGRIHKGGLLSSERVAAAITDPAKISRGKYNWTIVGAIEGLVNGRKYLYGELIKYDGNGAVAVVDEDRRVEQTLTAPGLIVDKSPFVFLDCFSGFVYLHVWNSIPEDVFRRRMAELIEEKYDAFFVPCEIEPISDVREFTAKLSEMKLITEIKAKVHPPNPLFGVCWENLKNFLMERGTQTLDLKEEGRKDSVGLKSHIQSVVEKIVDGDSLNGIPPLPLTDAAILMATDGYGKGKVSGVGREGEPVVVCTSETQKSFLYPKSPQPKALAEEAFRQLESVSKEREMRHAK